MDVLRIRQTKLGGNRFRVSMDYVGREATMEPEQEDLRWYLEGYLMYAGALITVTLGIAARWMTPIWLAA